MGGNKVRKKKYEKIKDLSSIICVQTILRIDYETEKKLVSRSYTITTRGGADVLWRVTEHGETFHTVSTSSIKKVRSKGFSYHLYRHYVLSDEGVQWLKGMLVEELI